MRSIAVSLIFLLCCNATTFSQDEHHHALTEQEVGSIHFLTSCSPQTSGDFNRAVALLHSFQYEDARAAFGAISERDPNCAMAKWGVAMSHYHGMWDNGDTAAGRRALNDLQDLDVTTAAGPPRHRLRAASAAR